MDPFARLRARMTVAVDCQQPTSCPRAEIVIDDCGAGRRQDQRHISPKAVQDPCPG